MGPWPRGQAIQAKPLAVTHVLCAGGRDSRQSLRVLALCRSESCSDTAGESPGAVVKVNPMQFVSHSYFAQEQPIAQGSHLGFRKLGLTQPVAGHIQYPRYHLGVDAFQ